MELLLDNMQAIVLYTIQIAVAVFFMLSGWHKVFVPARRAALVETLVADKVPFAHYCAPFIAWTELLAGIALLFTTWAALPLAGICIGALICDAPARVHEYKPIDWADYIDDWLYLPETWLFLVTILLFVSGAG